VGKLILFPAVFLLLSCASASARFPYRYYAIQATSYDGRLLGDKAENDISFTVCEPRDGRLAPCLVMLKDEYLQLKADYEALVEKVSCYESRRCTP